MHKVYSQLGRLGALKARPDMRDDEVTIETFIEPRTIYGSPKTVLSELAALRRTAGPFGTLLLKLHRLERAESRPVVLSAAAAVRSSASNVRQK